MNDAWPASLRSRRLSLRRAAAADPAPAWLAEAELAVLGETPGCPLSERVAAGDAVYWLRPIGGGGEPTLGALAARPDGEELHWTWLAVAAEARALGYGGAAVPILERAARRLGCHAARVLVPAGNGVALYFWLRLGYRPQPQAAQAKACPGTWMRRAVLPAR